MTTETPITLSLAELAALAERTAAGYSPRTRPPFWRVVMRLTPEGMQNLLDFVLSLDDEVSDATLAEWETRNLPAIKAHLRGGAPKPTQDGPHTMSWWNS